MARNFPPPTSKGLCYLAYYAAIKPQLLDDTRGMDDVRNLPGFVTATRHGQRLSPNYSRKSLTTLVKASGSLAKGKWPALAAARVLADASTTSFAPGMASAYRRAMCWGRISSSP